MRERLRLPSTRTTMSSVKPMIMVWSVASSTPALAVLPTGGSDSVTFHLRRAAVSSTSSKLSSTGRSITRVRRSG